MMEIGPLTRNHPTGGLAKLGSDAPINQSPPFANGLAEDLSEK
jgi:hypothetical protein